VDRRDARSEFIGSGEVNRWVGGGSYAEPNGQLDCESCRLLTMNLNMMTMGVVSYRTLSHPKFWLIFSALRYPAEETRFSSIIILRV
jgi:hypothetical protein